MSVPGGMPQQMTLDVQLRDEATLDNFLVYAAAETAVRALQQQVAGGAEQMILLHGPPGSGRSHLLQASCHAVGAGSLYLPLAVLRDFDAAQVLEGVGDQRLLCLDDVDAVAGLESWEEALFHLINRVRQSGCELLMSAGAAPRHLPLELPDLQSRLSWATVFALPGVDDRMRGEILVFRASRRGLHLAPAVVNYILSRAPRDLDSLLQLLLRLDQASLQHGRALSTQFVKQALDW